MADTVREKIVQAVVTALEGLVLGTGSGLTVQNVYREWRAPENEGELPYICVLDPGEEKTPGGSGGAPMEHTLVSLRIETWIILDVDNLRSEPASQTLNNAVGNVSKKLSDESIPDAGTLKSISGFNWLHDTGNEEFDLGEASVQTVRADYEIQYVHRANDPFTGRA